MALQTGQWLDGRLEQLNFLLVILNFALDKIIEVVISGADVKERAAMVMIFVLQWERTPTQMVRARWLSFTVGHLLDGLWKLRLNGFLGG